VEGKGEEIIDHNQDHLKQERNGEDTEQEKSFFSVLNGCVVDLFHLFFDPEATKGEYFVYVFKVGRNEEQGHSNQNDGRSTQYSDEKR